MGNWMKNVREVEPYVPGEQPLKENIIKLNTNENPYPPAPEVMEAAIKLGETGEDLLRKYPDPNASKLVQTLSAYHGVWPENVFVGVGSDDVLSVAFQTFFNGNKPLLFPDVTYSFYPVWAKLYGIKYQEVMVDAGFKIHSEDYDIPNTGIVIPNPNAPTGISIGLSDIENILEANLDSVVIIDEAYIDFGGQTAIPLIEKYDNLLVVRTFSKSRSLAGLRVGYAIGNEMLINAMNAVKFSINSYTMNAPAIQLGIASIKDDAYFKKSINQIKETRSYTVEHLKENNFMVLDSDANFVFARHVRHDAVKIFNELKKAKIYVRHFNSARINNYLRISIGTQEEMEKFFKELKGILTDLGSRF